MIYVGGGMMMDHVRNAIEGTRYQAEFVKR